MHSRATVENALGMSDAGASSVEIAAALGVPRRTVHDWLHGRVPSTADASGCDTCGGVHDLRSLPTSYVYLLGLYLGDGCLSRHPGGVYKLRITLDERYPGIVSDAVDAMRCVRGVGAVARRTDGCVEA